jgi:hypothetical protein
MPRRHGSALPGAKMPAGAARLQSAALFSDDELPIPPGDMDEELGGTLTEARTATERRRAELLDIELRLRRGELISKSASDKAHFRAGRLLRDRILGLAPRIAAAAFAAETLPDCQRILDRELRRALESVADEVAADE